MATGFVYFIRAEVVNLIRIGHTAGSPDSRFRRLASTSPAPLTPLGLMPGGVKLERRLHDRFFAHWSHGEWFRPDPALLEFIGREATEWKPIALAFRRSLPRGGMLADLRRWGEQFKMMTRGVVRTAAEWAELTGIPLETIRQFARDVAAGGGYCGYQLHDRDGAVFLEGYYWPAEAARTRLKRNWRPLSGTATSPRPIGR